MLLMHGFLTLHIIHILALSHYLISTATCIEVSIHVALSRQDIVNRCSGAEQAFLKPTIHCNVSNLKKFEAFSSEFSSSK